MPTRISTWFTVIAIFGGLCAMIRWEPLMMVPLAIIAFFVGPYFVRLVTRSFTDLLLGPRSPWNSAISLFLTAVCYGSLPMMVLFVLQESIHRREIPFLVLVSIGIAVYGGFVACLTLSKREKTWKSLSQHPLIWQAGFQGGLCVAILVYMWHERTWEPFVISWFALAFGFPLVSIARLELADRQRHGCLPHA